MMRLGNLQLNHFLVLAPMSGITDYPFRRIAMEKGCGLTFTGMVSAEGLLRKGKSFLRIEKDEHPISVQLFGSNPEVLANAAIEAEGMGADAIDINMGCPAGQVVNTGAGVDLMRFPEKVKRILVQVRKKVKVPLTVKIRSGWDKEHINAVEISKIAEGCGVDAISIHPRTKCQGFQGGAEWSLIGEVRRSVKIPVIGNGDVATSFSIARIIEETGCDGVMIGRGALGNPWIFHSRGSSTFEEKPVPFPSLEERQRVIAHHFSLLQSYYGEERAMQRIRRHVAWYSRGLPSSASFRLRLSGLKEKGALFDAVESYLNLIERKDLWPSCRSTENRSVIGPGERAF
jgi:tRNA-dihydrouridine synthase B